ncbi:MULTISPECIES: DHA2 family efflux MFS transporter permease subunit [Azorhizobium]|uniref:Putative multidrug efflux system protein n=1 Tax=Azorhizobium caulinodans (strain ATCC 43989 / DSM 5975 / JCM 20966 / LMG 6465 / NBRC 14845 / NCIMB 13405 / ORS 571) TaxID=438753 RepID=A8HWJ0_AZOC5|nr:MULTISPECIES: DHA2 family efflux MFS transporter permease subunit [Azorhizobium]TDT91148.1 DHA2 family multidrug resistance protein [Azorhizobium sp. AG788]BAF90435.1 putative multidrug efflux system protein [Azorhizobium caulinodans ORS 571]
MAGATAAGAPAEPQITPRRAIAFLALVFGMFMAILDIQIVSSSLSEIQAGISASSDEISWVQTSYLIAEVVMIPLSGFLARALSTRLLFALSAAGFTIASLLCATASSIGEMIFYRAVQGFIGGGMIPTAFAAAYTIFPKKYQAPVMSLVGLVVTLAPTIGPTVGGYLTSALSWHWLFLVNVPPGIVATLLCWFLVDFDEPEFDLLSRFDFTGLLGMAVFLGSLEYVLEEGERDDWFQSDTIVFFSVMIVIGAVLFFYRAFRAEQPVVDLRAYKDRNFAVGSILTFMLGVVLYGLTYLYPLFLAQVRGYNSLQTGETVFVTGIAMFIFAPIVGILGRKLDPRLVIGTGFVCLIISSFELTPITKDWGFYELMWPQLLRGAALMMCMVPINVVALGTLPPSQLKNASGLFNLMRNLGGAVGLAIINTVLNSRWDLHMARLRDAVTWSRPYVLDTLNSITAGFQARLGSDAELAATKKIAQMLRQQALVMAFSDVFLGITIFLCAAAFLVFLVRKPRASAGSAPAH